jgi:hypothetical protein
VVQRCQENNQRKYGSFPLKSQPNKTAEKRYVQKVRWMFPPVVESKHQRVGERTSP